MKGGYFPVPPVDGQSDIRAEMLSVMFDMGLKVEKHHHEVAPSQAEERFGNEFDTLVTTADAMQIYKYVVHNVANQYGKTATFMPKPIQGREQTARACTPASRCGRRAARPSPATSTPTSPKTALYYIGGIIKHAKAINAFTNPTTNSYKRLIPGFRGAGAARLPRRATARRRAVHPTIVSSSQAPSAFEVRFPDPACNPYLGFAAILMAAVDGIQNKIHPGDPLDKDLYDMPPEELKDVPTVCGSLRDALGALEADHAFLTKGEVFTRDQIERNYTSNSNGRRSTPSSTHPTPSSSLCIIPSGAEPHHNAKGSGSSRPFFFCCFPSFQAKAGPIQAIVSLASDG